MANYFLNDDGSTSLKRKNKKNGKNFIQQEDGSTIEEVYEEPKKEQLPKAKQKEPKQDSFSAAKNKLGDTLNNSFTKKNGLSFSNVVTDLANTYDATKNLLFSVPVAGNYFKAGDVAKKTIKNIATNMGEGALRDGEGILDFANNAADTINNKLSYQGIKLVHGKKKADQWLKEADGKSKKFIEGDLTTELLNKTGYNNKQFHKQFEEGSLVKRENLGGQVAQGVGGMVPSLLAGQYLGLGMGVPQTSLKELNALDKAKTVVRNVGMQFLENAGGTTALATSSYGQALQDAYQNGATTEQAQKYAIGSSAKEIATEWITGGIPGLKGTGGLDKPIEKLIDKSTGKLKNEYAKVIVKSLMNYGYKFVGEGLEEGLSEIIDPYLKNATYSKGEKVNWEGVLNSFIVGGLTGGILEAPNSAIDFNNNMVKANNKIQQSKTMLLVANTNAVNKNSLQSQNNIEGNPLIENKNAISLPLDNNTIQELNAINQNQERFIYKSSDNSKIDNFRRSANQFMNNSTETKSFVQAVEKVINDKAYNVTFDNSLGDNVNGRIGVNENGEVDIKINPNSERAGEFILNHEITHAIETKEMEDLVIDYASKNKDFNDALNSLKKVYGTNEVNAEVLADISGQLFGNQEFINTLSMKKPSVFKRIYNSIISLANKITGNSRESLFIKNLKNKWEMAYRENNNSLGTSEEYSLLGKTKNNNISKLSDELVLEIQEKTKSNQKNKDNVKFVVMDEILPFKKNGGYRNSEEVNKLTNNIMANGIESPIEVMNRNGKLEIYNGNHRLEVARKLGLKEVPITFINENVESTVNSLYNDNVSSYIEGEDNGSIARAKKSQESNDKSRNNIRYSLDDSEQSSIESRISRNGRLSDTLLGNNDRTSGYSASSENDTAKTKRELGNGSFSLSEASKNSNKWKQFVEDNFKSAGTKTDLNKIQIKNVTDMETANDWLKSLGIAPYLKVEEKDKNFILYDKEFNTIYKTYKSKEELSKKIFNDTISEFGSYIKDNVKKANIDLGKSILEYKDIAKDASKRVKRTRKEVQRSLLHEMNIKLEDIQVGEDISSFNFQRTDPVRVNEKVFGETIGKKINEATIYKTKENTAKKIRWQNQERDSINKLGIKAGSKESAAVQKYGEKKYVNKYGELVKYDDRDLANDFPNVQTQERIKKAANYIRNKYDNYLEYTNNILTEMGYDEIPKREDYMRHFSELTDIFSQIGIPFNLNEIRAEDLPTDINGLTENNRPGKSYFASAQHRTGEKTTYDAIKGIDGYIESAGNLIFHTEDIQRYRALSKMIRNTYGQVEGLKNIENLSETEFAQRVQDIQSNKLSKYVAWLDEQANSLAGKKGAIDRGTERLLGRKGYTILNKLKSQVGSNMTGLNVRSAMTNFISTTLAASKTSKISFVKGTVDTINNIFTHDDFVNESDFLTSRFGSESLSSTPWQKISKAGQILMSGSDYFASNLIVRSKYYEGLSKGMSKYDAMKYADDFGARALGDRSQGSTAEIFNSKTLGLITQFQLEVNNQWDYMLHDSKIDFNKKRDSMRIMSAGAQMLFQLGQIAVYSHLVNKLFKKFTGSDATFDPIEIFKAIFGLGDDYDDENTETRLEKAKDLLVNNLPFASVFTNGRIPLQEALPLQELLSGKDKYGRDKSRIEIIKETLPYYILPTGYSQIKKTKAGLEEYKKNLNPLSKNFLKNREVSGSYTSKGKLRFTTKKDIGSVTQNLLFGQYSSKEAREYFDKGYLPIDSKTLDKLQKQGVSVNEYRKYTNDKKELGLNDIKSDTDEEGKSIKGTASAKKALAIMNSNYSKKEKEYLISNLSSSDNSVSLSELNNLKKDEKTYKFYFGLNEDNRKTFKKELNDLGMSSNELIKYYETRKEYKDTYTSNYSRTNLMNYINSLNVSNNTKWHLYNKDYGSDNLSVVVDKFNLKYRDYYNVKKYSEEISTRYSENKNSKTRKQLVFKYINDLKLNKAQKSILFKEAGYSDSTSKKIVFNYINSMNISKQEKQKLYNSIY